MLLKLDVWHQRCAYLNKLFCKSFWRGILVRHMRREFGIKLPYIGPFSITTQRRIKKSVNTFSSNLDIKLVFTPFKIKSWFGSRILSLPVYDRELFISFHVQAVVRYVGETNRTSPLASANISPLTNIPTSLRTWEVLKIVAPLFRRLF